MPSRRTSCFVPNIFVLLCHCARHINPDGSTKGQAHRCPRPQGLRPGRSAPAINPEQRRTPRSPRSTNRLPTTSAASTRRGTSSPCEGRENLYSRTGNPTQAVFEQRLADLDGGVAALATGSGQSAVAVALLTLAKSGQHIVAARQLYGGTVDLLTDTFADFGIEVTLVDQDDLDGWRAAARPETRAFFAETIGNPVASVLDVRAVADIAHEAGVPLIVDNTIATRTCSARRTSAPTSPCIRPPSSSVGTARRSAA